MWSKACCAPNNKGEATTCVRQSAMKWMCQLESLVASNAYSKTVRKARLLLASTALKALYAQLANASLGLMKMKCMIAIEEVLDIATHLFLCFTSKQALAHLPKAWLDPLHMGQQQGMAVCTSTSFTKAFL